MKIFQSELAAATLCLTLLACVSAKAGDDGKMVVAPPPAVAPEPWSYCDLFDYATFYSDSNNPVMQKLAFTGRLQADAAFFDSSGADSYERLLWRRFRAGVKMQLFGDFTLHSEADLDLNNHDPLYNQLTDTYVAWSPTDAFKLKVGKQSAGFTLDGATSSKKLVRMERSVVAENIWFTREYYSGVAASGKIDNTIYNFGVFSGDLSNPEFGEFDAGYFGLASIGYDFGAAAGVEHALVRLDYVYNDPNVNNATRDLEHIVSLNSHIENGNWGLSTDVAGASGYFAQSDLFAVQLMPFYNITDQLQLATSYNYVTSSGDNGVRLDRYEKRVVSGRSDELHEFYAGVNYYICGHKLKWQTGVEYTYAEDDANDGGAYDGWGVSSGIRISW